MQPHLDIVLCNNSSKPYFIEIPGTSKPQYCHRSFHSLRTAEPQRPRSKPATIINVGFYTRFAVWFIIFYYYCTLLIIFTFVYKRKLWLQSKLFLILRNQSKSARWPSLTPEQFLWLIFLRSKIANNQNVKSIIMLIS